jgi:ABC-type Fe3+-citrate transport system substrate-binding protein
MWRSDATKAALRGTKTEVATKALPANEAYSDRARMKDWSNEKEKLEKSLALGNDKAYYADQLKKMGYQITSTNDQEKDYVEYEVVKGRDSYEVQIDFDGGKAKKVDVTTNMWQSDATDKALSAKKNDKVAQQK